jgi:hypothetical protein
MYRSQQSILQRSRHLAGLIVLLAATPSLAETAVPKQVESFEYKATVNEDPAAKICQLGLTLRDHSAGQGVNFQLMVAQMKREGALAGPLVTGFTVDSRSLKFAPRASRPAAKLASVAFVSERYTSVALPKVAPFQDGSVATSTLDFAEGRELVAAVLRADFALSFTRANSNAVQSYKVGAPPPAEVLAEFSMCVGSLASL